MFDFENAQTVCMGDKKIFLLSTYNFLLQSLQVSPSLATALAFSASVKCRGMYLV
jgi:hypothetical protein